MELEPPPDLLPSKHDLLKLIAVVAIASSVAFTCNFIATSLNPTPKPFCDSSDSFSDICEPCPSNGECSQGKLECAYGYRKHRNMCIEDGAINERANKLAELVESRLCEAYAQFLCHGSGIIWVQEDIIWNDLEGHKLIEDFAPDAAIYAYTKKRAMEIMETLLEMRMNSNGNKELKCPDLVAEGYKPVTCRLSQWISKHAVFVAAFSALVLGSALLLRKLQRRWYLSTRANELYEQVCEILEENALKSKQSNGESWIVASQLRDHLLLPKERKDPILWKRVEEFIQEDSRVARYPKLVKGDSKVVWEWEVGGSWSSARKRKMVETSKLKSKIDVKENTGRRIHAMKSGLHS